MEIGLYFGTFNPIHSGHLIIANHIAEFSSLDQVWMMVTPHNPLKQKSTLLEDHHRLEMVFLATKDYPKIKPSDFEFKLPQPNYTVNTLAHLQDKFPQHRFSLIMGEDNIKTIHKWKNFEFILENYPIYVYPRINPNEAKEEKPIDFAFLEKNKAQIHNVDAPIVEISSTFVREKIKLGKNVRPLLPSKVWEYIDHNNLYKK